MRKQSANEQMLTRLFFKLLPVQILVVAMGSINSLVDGAMIGRFISADLVGVVGLFFTVVQLLSAVGAVMLGGTTVLCGIYMGRGELRKTEGIFPLNLTVTFLIGLVLTSVCVLMPGAVADVLGANAELRKPLMRYIMGYAIGIIPQLLGQQLASFLELERKSKIGYLGIVSMILANVLLNILFVAILQMDVLGLALATALCNWVYFLVLVPYYFTKKAQLRFDIRKILWGELSKLLKIGLPGALLIACLAVRSLVINRILLQYGGQDGLSAMSAFTMVNDLLISVCLGIASVVRMLASVFVGEEDRMSMKSMLRIVFTKCMAVCVAIGIAVILLSSVLTGIFFSDPNAAVFQLTKQLFIIFGCCIPLILVCVVSSRYFQALGHNGFVNAEAVVDGFVGMVVPAAILAPALGAMGVWLANPIGIVLTILVVPVYSLIYWKHIPRNIDEWLFLKPDFGVADENRLEVSISRVEDVTQTAQQVHAFCNRKGTSGKTAYYAALCLEEMTANIVEHGFSADKHSHRVNCLVVYSNDGILLRIKDDCIPFDPKEMADVVNPEDPVKNIGVRMVYRLAQSVTYQNLLGMNVLTITLADEKREEK